jgi:2'-5' RNA ligase
MRLFLGIELPENIKQEIYNFLLPLHKNEKQWERAHDYHQTLLFIGDSTEEQLEFIKERMSLIKFPPFELETSEFKFLRRRLLYLDLVPSPELILLHKQVHELFPEWIRPDEKGFLVHITVKRWQRHEYDDLVNGLKGRSLPSMKFNVNSLALFKSERDLNSNKYHVIHRTQ